MIIWTRRSTCISEKKSTCVYLAIPCWLMKIQHSGKIAMIQIREFDGPTNQRNITSLKKTLSTLSSNSQPNSCLTFDLKHRGWVEGGCKGYRWWILQRLPGKVLKSHHSGNLSRAKGWTSTKRLCLNCLIWVIFIIQHVLATCWGTYVACNNLLNSPWATGWQGDLSQVSWIGVAKHWKNQSLALCRCIVWEL